MSDLSNYKKRKYIRGGGLDIVGCPYCGNSTDEDDAGFHVGELDPVEDGGIEQKIGCLNCGKMWIDYFKLKEIRPIFGDARELKL